MHVRYIEPIGSDHNVPRATRVLESAAAAETEISIDHLRLPAELAGPMLPAQPLYLSELQRAVISAVEAGADAAVIGCCSDPGLQEAQRSAAIPVIGPLQAAAAASASRGRTLGILFPDEHDPRTTINWVRRNLRAYGLNDLVPEIRMVPMHDDGEASLVGDASADSGLVEDRFRRQLRGPAVEIAQQLTMETAVDAILFGCTLWGGMVDEVSDAVDAWCIDPMHVALRTAEMHAAFAVSTR